MARTPIFIEVKDSSGNVVPAASVNIKRRQNGADATLYNAETAGSVIANPQTADSLGRVSVWVDRGDYNAFVTGTGISPYTVPIDAGPTGDAEIDLNWLPASVQSLASGTNTYTVQTGGTMPASPANGDEVIYTADATNGTTWHFKYRSASASAYKWEFIGGGWLYNEVVGATNLNSVAGVWTDGSTPGPDLTAPLSGDYEVSLWSSIGPNGGTAVGFWSLGVTTVGGTPGSTNYVQGPTVPSATTITPEGTVLYKGLTAGTVYRMRWAFNMAGCSVCGVNNRCLKMRPIRVS